MYTFLTGEGRPLTSIVVLQPSFLNKNTAKRFFVSTPAQPKWVSLEVQGIGPVDIPLLFTTWTVSGLLAQNHSVLCQTTGAPVAYHYDAPLYIDAVLVVDIGVETASVIFTAGHRSWYRMCIVKNNKPAKYLRSEL